MKQTIGIISATPLDIQAEDAEELGPESDIRDLQVGTEQHGERLDKAFLAGADARGLLNLKGHRSVGGMRASIYNALGLEAVEGLVAYMAEFEKEHG